MLQGGEIHLLADLNDYFTLIGERERAPRWAQALAMPARSVILLRVPDPEPVKTLTHELSHLAVHEAVGQNHVPRWFMEGYAMYQAEEFDMGRLFAVSTAALFGNTLPFQQLDHTFPPHSQQASLAYAQSFHFVKRLLENYGPLVISNWLDAISDGQDWQEAFESAFGVGFWVEVSRWEGTVRVWYAWVPVAVSMTSLWAGLGLLLGVGRRRVKARRDTKLQRMAVEEAELYPPDPDDHLFG